MGLESLLQPIKWVDEQVLRQYTKVTKKWEDKGNSRYMLALGLTLGGVLILELGSVYYNIRPEEKHQFEARGFWENLPAYGYVGAYTTLFFHDLLDTLHSVTRNNSSSSGLIAEDKFNYVSRKIQRAVRLPLLAVGIEAYYEFAKSIVNSQDTLWAGLALGSAFLGLASSMYIKDSDPKLLQKAPFWEKAAHWLQERINSPQPEPMQAFTIEDYTPQNEKKPF